MNFKSGKTMRFNPIAAIVVSFIISSCAYHTTIDSTSGSRPRLVTDVYRVPLNEIDGKKIWIVDGLVIRRDIYPEFLYGGNNQRYLFVPKNEIWIDHAISAEEYEYTLAHEILERNLMAKKGLSYADAHDSSLALERRMRIKDFNASLEHEKSLHKVSPTDCDNVKEIPSLPDSIRLKNIYRIHLYSLSGIDIWIVDGDAVRRDIFPDFGLSGNDLAYKFIPSKEIWIDSETSCEETGFSISSELKERELMQKGIGYDDAYMETLKMVKTERNNAFELSKNHEALLVTNILDRDIGTGDEK